MAYFAWGDRRAPWLAALIGVHLGILSGGCGQPASDHNAELMAPGDPEIELGSRSETSYVPLATDSSVAVIWGAQGGTWIMPVLRVRGIASPMQVTGALALESGELLGDADSTLALEAREGWLESARFAVPVQHAPPREFESIEDLYGQMASLSVQAVDTDGRFADYEVRVELREP